MANSPSIIFCDHDFLIDEYQKVSPVSSETLIATFSPKMRFSLDRNIVDLNAKWSAKERLDFQASIPRINKEIYAALSPTAFREYATVSAMLINRLSRLLYYARCCSLLDIDFDKTHITILSLGKSKNPPSFVDHSQINAASFVLTDFKPNNYFFEPDKSKTTPLEINNYSGLLNRIKLGGANLIKFKLKKLLYKKSRPQVIVIRENELLIDALSQANFSFQFSSQIEKAFNKKVSPNKAPTKDVFAVINPLIEEWINSWIKTDLKIKVKNAFYNEFDLQLNKFFNQLKMYGDYFADHKDVKSVFSSSPAVFRHIPIIEAAKLNNIPTVAFQHGVSHELCLHHDEANAFYDSGAADICIGYSELALAGEKIHGLGKAKTFFSSGASSRHLKLCDNFQVGNGVLFVSTLLLRGAWSFIINGSDEVASMKSEMGVIKHLNKANNVINYKAYPETALFCYEKNLVKEYVQSATNIKTFSSDLDLRFVIKNYHLIICGRATSTITWIILSNIPFIYIEFVNDTNLTDDAKLMLKDAVFYLDYQDPEFGEKLIKLVNTPKDELLALYEQKRKARKIFIHKYISDHTNPDLTGKNIANFLEKHLS